MPIPRINVRKVTNTHEKTQPKMPCDFIKKKGIGKEKGKENI